MKKMISILMALVLCMTCISALGEAADYSQDEVSVTLPTASSSLEKPELGGSAKALNSSDDVVNNGGAYTVKTQSGLTLKLDASKMAYMVLTQSYYASLDIYSRFNDDSDAVAYIDNLISNDIHYVIWDSYGAFDYIYVRTLGADSLATHVRNMNMLNESEQNAVANAIASSCDLSDYSLYEFNGSVWIQLGANVLITIANSQYVQVLYMPTGDAMTEDDYADFTDFMNLLTLE